MLKHYVSEKLNSIYFSLLALKLEAAVIGYPKTGNTWLNVILGKLIIERYNLKDTDFSEVFVRDLKNLFIKGKRKNIPGIHFSHCMPFFNEESFEQMKFYNKPFLNKKVILLIRNPKDTLVSLYMHNKYRLDKPLYEKGVNDMVFDPVYGIGKYLKFYQIWFKDLKSTNKLMLVKYEDLHKDTFGVMKKVVKFLELKGVSDHNIKSAIEFSKFDNMRKMELNNYLKLPALGKSSHNNTESFKVRKGKIGDYKNHLNTEIINKLDKMIEEKLPTYYGYHNHTKNVIRS